MQTYDGFVLPSPDKLTNQALPRWCCYCGEFFDNFDIQYHHKKLEHINKAEYLFCGFCGNHRDELGEEMWDHYSTCGQEYGWYY